MIEFHRRSKMVPASISLRALFRVKSLILAALAPPKISVARL
ncbi:hypothetical protein T1E_3079 [Pseudomonas putida DOT-T1E]|uniref:Uncharacterized protein n=1 Tax=Pseudomonas putida (strain DOT-T1E) TaxID=1196325 RepID=I7C719_PSEPT|nr:hypothetical protein T1E_3079 [Pseudomonas putida DOT-T1E]